MLLAHCQFLGRGGWTWKRAGGGILGVALMRLGLLGRAKRT